MGFLRKVYGLLAAQLTITTMIAAACLFTPALSWLLSLLVSASSSPSTSSEGS